MREPVLVASVDGVGTKLKIAFAMDKHDTIGADLVNHCVNDIARSWRASAVLPRLHRLRKTRASRVPAITSWPFSRMSSGRLRAAGRRNCANARNVSQGRIRSRGLHRRRRGSDENHRWQRRSNPATSFSVSLPTGLHTNGYSLARKILFEKMRLKVEFGSTRDRESRSEKNCCACTKIINRSWQKFPVGVIKGLAHITGGGLIDNLPRILPSNCDAVIETKSWRVPRIFQILQKNGNVDAQEMYQVFNMGIGMVAIVAERNARRVMSILRAKRIGRIEPGSGRSAF